MQNKRISETINEINESLRPFLEVQSKIKRNIAPVIETIDKLSLVVLPVLKKQQAFLDSIKEIEESRGDTRKVMLSSGWWLTPSLMDSPASWIDDAVVKYKNGNKKAIFDLFRKVYQNDDCKNLELLVTEWKRKSLLNPWSKHLDDALKAHRQKQYTLSVPVLLLVAEGVAGEFCKKNGINVNKSSGKDKIQKSTQNHYHKTDNLLLSYLDLLEGALSNTIYEHTDKLKSNLRKNILNRHAVLHGVKKDYGSMKTSLQAFMMIDILSELS